MKRFFACMFSNEGEVSFKRVTAFMIAVSMCVTFLIKPTEYLAVALTSVFFGLVGGTIYDKFLNRKYK